MRDCLSALFTLEEGAGVAKPSHARRPKLFISHDGVFHRAPINRMIQEWATETIPAEQYAKRMDNALASVLLRPDHPAKL